MLALTFWLLRISFPPQQQAKLVQMLKRNRVPVMWITVHSDKGHDAFLLEPRLFTPHIQHVLDHHEEAP